MLTILLPKSFFDCRRPQPAQFGSKTVSMLLLFCDIRRRASNTTPGQTANFFSHILGVPSGTLIWKKVVCDRVLFEFRMQALYVLYTQRSILSTSNLCKPFSRSIVGKHIVYSCTIFFCCLDDPYIPYICHFFYTGKIFGELGRSCPTGGKA